MATKLLALVAVYKSIQMYTTFQTLCKSRTGAISTMSVASGTCRMLASTIVSHYTQLNNIVTTLSYLGTVGWVGKKCVQTTWQLFRIMRRASKYVTASVAECWDDLLLEFCLSNQFYPTWYWVKKREREMKEESQKYNNSLLRGWTPITDDATREQLQKDNKSLSRGWTTIVSDDAKDNGSDCRLYDHARHTTYQSETPSAVENKQKTYCASLDVPKVRLLIPVQLHDDDTGEQRQQSTERMTPTVTKDTGQVFDRVLAESTTIAPAVKYNNNNGSPAMDLVSSSSQTVSEFRVQLRDHPLLSTPTV